MKRFLKLFNHINHKYGHRLDHWWLGHLLCLFGFTLTILAFYPGYMSPDSVANLATGRDGFFYDINSPVMSWFWGVLDSFYSGPALMLIVHNLVFWGGCAIFWRTAKKRSSKLGISLILLGFMPQILSQLSTIWKDIGLAVSLFFAVAILYYSAEKKSKIFLFITPVFLFYAFAARLNSFPAIIPLMIWTGIVIYRVFELNFSKSKKLICLTLFSLIYFSGLMFIVSFVNNRLTAGRTVYPFQQVLLYDLAAISKGRKEALFPDYIVREKSFSLEKVESEYNIISINSLIYGDRPAPGDAPILKLSNDPEEINVLWEKWRETILENKELYLSHRTKVFGQLVGFNTKPITGPYWYPGFGENPPEFRPEPNLLNRILMQYFHIFRKQIVFRCFFWLFLCVFFIYKAVKNKFQSEWEIIFFLSISAIFYALAYFPTAPSTEFRYILWSELAAAIAGVFACFILFKHYIKRVKV